MAEMDACFFSVFFGRLMDRSFVPCGRVNCDPKLFVQFFFSPVSNVEIELTHGTQSERTHRNRSIHTFFCPLHARSSKLENYAIEFPFCLPFESRIKCEIIYVRRKV